MIDPALAEEQPAQIDIQRIMEMIPHRHPFLMIDKVVDAVANVRATGVKNVSINEQYFQGHFPARPVMPGVLIIEAMAQTAAVLVLSRVPNRENKVVFFASITEAKFRKPVVPGDQLRIEVNFLKLKPSAAKIQGRATVDGAVVAEAEILATLGDKQTA